MLITRGYISSWMGSEPTYTWGPFLQDKTGCICMLLASFMLLIIHIYMFFSDWLVWCLPGESIYVENYTSDTSTLCKEHPFIHSALCIDTWHSLVHLPNTWKAELETSDSTSGSRAGTVSEMEIEQLWCSATLRDPENPRCLLWLCASRHSTCRF